jgi:hypothetical protein
VPYSNVGLSKKYKDALKVLISSFKIGLSRKCILHGV